MNSLFKVYLIKRHALYHVLESLYLWESLEDKENNHSDIRYRFVLLWKRDGDGGRDGGMGLCVRRHETEDTVCSGFSPDKNKLMRSLQQKHRSSSHSSSHLYLIFLPVFLAFFSSSAPEYWVTGSLMIIGRSQTNWSWLKWCL